MPGEYAKTTTVSVASSQEEIQRTLSRFGAGKFSFAYDNDAGEAAIVFERKGLRVLMRMPLPPRAQFERDTRGHQRTESAVEKDHQQAIRQRWRSLANGVKAKLALIDDGISTVEQEFMGYILLPGGKTVFQEAMPAVREAYRTGVLPPMLPGVSITALPDGHMSDELEGEFREIP